MEFRLMHKIICRNLVTDMYKPKFVVIIPTYLRVEALGCCLEALEKQTILPDEIIIVRRESDIETKDFLNQYNKKRGALNTTVFCVIEAGFLPPIKEGLKMAKGDYVGILDDDVLVGSNWVETGLLTFKKNGPCLGAINGASIGQDKSGTVFPARLFWFGRFAVIKNKSISTKKINGPNEGNMIIRGEVSTELDVDMRLNSGRIAHHGLDFGLQLIMRGWEIQYEPQLNAYHLALRAQSDVDNPLNVSTFIHNLTHIINKHYGKIKLFVFVFYNLVVGQHDMPGLLYGFFRHVTPSKRVSVARRALILELFQRI